MHYKNDKKFMILLAISAGSGPPKNSNVILSRGNRAFSSPEYPDKL